MKTTLERANFEKEEFIPSTHLKLYIYVLVIGCVSYHFRLLASTAAVANVEQNFAELTLLQMVIAPSWPASLGKG